MSTAASCPIYISSVFVPFTSPVFSCPIRTDRRLTGGRYSLARCRMRSRERLLFICLSFVHYCCCFLVRIYSLFGALFLCYLFVICSLLLLFFCTDLLSFWALFLCLGFSGLFGICSSLVCYCFCLFCQPRSMPVLYSRSLYYHFFFFIFLFSFFFS